MAISASGLWNARTDGNAANGGGFVRGTTGKATDLAATLANTASPVVTSVSYTFVAGDVGAWLYIATGTNWTPGWYQIASVAGGAATLTAGIGTATLDDGTYLTNTVAGCATVASPTGGTWANDYSRQASPQFTYTDIVIDGVTNTDATSALLPFSVAYVGNILNVTSGAGFTVQRVEAKSIVSGVIMRFDKSLGLVGSTDGNGKMGGAFAHVDTMHTVMTTANAGADDQKGFIMGNAGAMVYSTAVASGFGVGSRPGIEVKGYSTIIGDMDENISSLANAPTIKAIAGCVQVVTYASGAGSNRSYLKNVIIDGNSIVNTVGIYDSGLATFTKNVKIMGCAGNTANLTFGGYSSWDRVEATGTTTVLINEGTLIGKDCYFHDYTSHVLTLTSGLLLLKRCIIDTVTTATKDAVRCTGSHTLIEIDECSIYNVTGTGVNLTALGATKSITVQNTEFEACAVAAMAANVGNNAWRSCGNGFFNNLANHTNVTWVEAVVSHAASVFNDPANGDFTLHATNGITAMGTGLASTISGTATQINPSKGASQGLTANRGDATPAQKGGFGQGGVPFVING